MRPKQPAREKVRVQKPPYFGPLSQVHVDPAGRARENSPVWAGREWGGRGVFGEMPGKWSQIVDT